MSTTRTVLWWLAGRGLVLALLYGPESWVTGDVAYFAHSIRELGQQGLGHTLVEYPLLGVLLIALPWMASGALGHADLYPTVLMLAALLTDAAFTVLLALTRRQASDRSDGAGGPGGPGAVGVWLLAVPLLGATVYARFDLVPGVLAACALLALATRPRLAGVCVAAATAAKLWPALLVPALAAPLRGRARVLVAGTATGLLLLAASLLAAGWNRLVSPLTWQGERGLQIESVAATPAMLGWAAAPGTWTVRYAASNAFEVSGPGVGVLLVATRLLLLLAGVALAALWLAAWRRGRAVTADAVVWLALAGVTAFMVSSKVLSPQYLLWLLPLTAAALAVADDRSLRTWATGLLAVTGATHLVFPLAYGALVTPGAWSPVVVLLLAGRNTALVALLAMAALRARRALAETTQRGSALDRQPPLPAAGDLRTRR